MRNACEIACRNYGAWCAQMPTVILLWRAPFHGSSGEGISPATGQPRAFISVRRQERDERQGPVRHSRARRGVIREMNACLTTNIR